MSAFLLAALPWVVMGLAVIILVVTHHARHSKASDNTEQDGAQPSDSLSKAEIASEEGSDKKENYMTEGMAIGMCLGAALSTLGLFDIGVGVSIGMLLGLAVGSTIKK